MNIIVCVKQVPDPETPASQFRVDEAAKKVLPPPGIQPTVNQYDANAISVWIRGKKVGHLSREDAAAMRAGLLDLQTRVRGYVAVPGQIISGGPVGTLGVILRFNPADFGLEAPARPASRPAEGGGVRTGFGLALSRDSGDDRYDLDWVAKIGRAHV